MEKTFEDWLAEIQTDMIDACLEYADYKADAVYIYASYEEQTISCDYFYRIGDSLYERHKLNEIEALNIDVSVQRQEACLKILNKDIEKLIDVCKDFDMDMPTEIKLIYDVKRNHVSADYEYELQYSNTAELMADDLAEAWFEQELQRISDEK